MYKIKKLVTVLTVLTTLAGSRLAQGMNADFDIGEKNDLETSLALKFKARNIFGLLKKMKDKNNQGKAAKCDPYSNAGEIAKDAKCDLVKHVKEICEEFINDGYGMLELLDVFAELGNKRIFKIALKHFDLNAYFAYRLANATPKKILFMPVYYNSKKDCAESCGITPIGLIEYLLPNSAEQLTTQVTKVLEVTHGCKKEEKGITWFADMQNAIFIQDNYLVIFPFIADKSKHPEYKWNKLEPDSGAEHITKTAKNYDKNNPTFFVPEQESGLDCDYFSLEDLRKERLHSNGISAVLNTEINKKDN